jgi:hypothetical protein
MSSPNWAFLILNLNFVSCKEFIVSHAKLANNKSANPPPHRGCYSTLGFTETARLTYLPIGARLLCVFALMRRGGISINVKTTLVTTTSEPKVVTSRLKVVTSDIKVVTSR